MVRFRTICFSGFLILVVFLVFLVLLFPNVAFAHTLNNQICEDVGLLLDSMNNVCVADLSIVCLITTHGDSFRGGFTNIGTDQFGNTCREVHPDDLDLFPISPTSPIIDLLGVMILALTLIVVSILVFIVARKVMRKR